jgi:chromosome partitioning protein
VADGPGGLREASRTLLLLADLALFPISPSILDLRSVSRATAVLKYAQSINGGKPKGRVILNRIRKRDTISRELQMAAPSLDLIVAKTPIHDLQVYRDAAQQGTVVSRMGFRGRKASLEMTQLFLELLTGKLAFPDHKEPCVKQVKQRGNLCQTDAR